MRNLWCLGLLIFYPLLTHQRTLPSSQYYVGAVVQYTPSYVPSSGKTATYQNAENYEKIIKRASELYADIVVFPESGLSIPPSYKLPSLHHTATYVPEPSEGIILCVNKTQRYSQFLKTLSCAAIDNEIYVVLNLLEKKDCCHGKNNTCGSGHIFETNLVLDRSGRVVAKYRWYDHSKQRVPPKIAPTYFTADFGVTFGLLANRDILTKSPALNLTKDHKVRDILLSTNLTSELPFAAAVELQAAYAHAYDVNLLAAGLYAPSITNGDSGIYFGRDGIVQARATNKASNILITTYVPKFKLNGSRTMNVQQEYTKVHEFSASDIPTSKNTPGNYTNKANLLQSITKLLDLNETSFIKSLCHGDFCCNYDVEFNLTSGILNPNSQYYRYRLAVYNGSTSLSGVQLEKTKICAVIACTGESLESCGRLLNSTDVRYKEPVQFERIEIEVPSNVTKGSEFVPSGLFRSFKVVNATQDYTFESSESRGLMAYKIKYVKGPTTYNRGSLLNFAVASYNFESDN